MDDDSTDDSYDNSKRPRLESQKYPESEKCSKDMEWERKYISTDQLRPAHIISKIDKIFHKGKS